jgi:integrase
VVGRGSGARLEQLATATDVPVRFEVTEQTRQAVDDYICAAHKKPGEFLFAAPHRRGYGLSTRQYARLVGEWIRGGIGLDPCMFGTHSLRRTKATLINRRTGNLRAVQLLLGHHKIESTVRYLGIEVDDAFPRVRRSNHLRHVFVTCWRYCCSRRKFPVMP